MKLAVFSDSHEKLEPMRRALADYQPDAVIHLGDHVRDAEAIAAEHPALPFHMVRGNCDLGFTSAPEELLLELEGVRIFASHGHQQRVKLGLLSFCNSVHFSGARLGLFGHTHQAVWKQQGALEIFNPGSIGAIYRPTYGQIELKNGCFSCRVAELK